MATNRATSRRTPAPARRDRVDFDLDVIEREGTPVKPFVFRAGGKTFTLADAQDVDWRDLMRVFADPPQFFKLLMEPGERQEFLKLSIPSWKIRAMAESYREHYGIPAPGESGASSVY